MRGHKALLEEIAEKVAGKRIPVTVVDRRRRRRQPRTTPVARATRSAHPKHLERPKKIFGSKRMADPSVQALFEIFPVEKSKIEEMIDDDSTPDPP